jgi:DNA polymerase III delta prime subunit
MSTIPFVEKYRPSCMDDIILNNINKTIINNIIKTKSYPNLLLYGPPGTGKTTTVINLVKQIQNSSNKSLLLHLNASDERGIDTIRNQITRFINSKPLFSSGIKFIILDEVDYMTKSAQLALKYLLQQYNNKAVFCLMCNYISKIESTLKSEFIELKFNKLPKENIVLFLKEIARKEQISIDDDDIHQLQELFDSDIRSMINYLQLNYTGSFVNRIKMSTNDNIKVLFLEIKKESNLKIKLEMVEKYSIEYNLTPKDIFIKMFMLLIYDQTINDTEVIKRFELLLHEEHFSIHEIEFMLLLFTAID